MTPPDPALPLWTALPFAVYLFLIAGLPLLAPRFWERNRNKFLLALTASLPVVAFLALSPHAEFRWLWESAQEYAAFMALLSALFIISGGIHLEGSLPGTPRANTAVLAAGAVLANLIGTAGASLILIRPLLRANERRARKVHLVIFFIFIVSNCGGLLTPLGDPPLFLGFLRGVPFFWTLRLAAPWALVNGGLLLLFATLDRALAARELRTSGSPRLDGVPPARAALRLRGGINLILLVGVTLGVFGVESGGRRLGWGEEARKAIQITALAALAGLSLACTPGGTRAANRFSWGPILEVAGLFVGIFITLIPLLKILEQRGPELGLIHPWQFFWASGALSSVLDNAPTYLAFSTAAVGVVHRLDPGAVLGAGSLEALAQHPQGAGLLAAVSAGSVLMGALTYIGNGPNFMVKAIAEEQGIRMPGFLGYLAWSVSILIPLFLLLSILFFHGAPRPL